MVGHIIKLAEELKRRINQQQKDKFLNIFDFPKMISEELEKIDTRNFPPNVRYDFIIVREKFRFLRRKYIFNLSEEKNDIIRLCNELIDILKNWSETNKVTIRNFCFVSDKELKNIIERDYKELICILFPEGAWKSVVVMCGSILEAILYDILSRPQNKSKALNSSKAPRGKNFDEGKWSLHDLIEVAVDVGILPQERANTIDQVIRNYRNFVHPKKEIRSQYSCTEAEAYMARGMLDSICDYFKEKYC